MSSSLHSTSSDEQRDAPDQTHGQDGQENNAGRADRAGVTPARRITELEGQIVDLHQRLADRERQQRELDEFISLLAHDLRTPLTSIRGYSQLLLRQISSHGADAERLRGGLNTVIQQADRLSDLTNVLLDIARVRTGRLALRRGAVDMAHVARSVLEATLSRPNAPLVHLDAPPSGPMVDGDSQRITQAIRSLVDFSIERTPPSHAVTIRLTTLPKAGPARLVEIAVSDEGPLLTRDEASRLLHQLVKPAQGGPMERALGQFDLYIARGIAETHGGSIEVESPAPGTSFGAGLTLRLPLEK